MPRHHTIVQELLTAAAAGVPARFAVRSTVRIGRQQGVLIGVDNGNDALKIAVLRPDGTLITRRIPAAYRAAALIRGGASEVSYRVDGAPGCWIGETALRHDGDDLPIGPTRQRLTDPRLRHLLAAGLVEVLHAAGYAPGSHTLVLGLAIPNTEIVPVRGAGADEGERLGVDPETRQVLEQHLTGVTWSVERLGADGDGTAWQLRLATVLPQAQTTGTLVAVTKAPTGTTVTDVEEMDIVDIGGGDLQVTTVQIQPTYRMTTRRLGDGTIRIARALKEHFPRHELTDVAAQHALITRRLLVSGRQRPIDAEVAAVLNSQGQALIGAVLPVLRQSRRFVMITGGGVILLHDLLQPRLEAELKRRGEDYDFIHHGIASEINSIGVLFAALFRAAAATRS